MDSDVFRLREQNNMGILWTMEYLFFWNGLSAIK